jgi:hypothetical protein
MNCNMKRTIYKYFRINQFLYDTLISNQLYFSSIQQFNDPYDCYLTLFDEISEDDLKIYLKKINTSDELTIKCIEAFNKKGQKFLEPFIESYKAFIDYHGICCFTKGKDNLLLWSHYADSHKGVCLGFDYDLMIKKFPQFDEVEYSDNPFYFDIKNVDESIAKTVLRKSTDWKYEEEIRFVMERSKSIGFFQDALTEVNFGTRCSKRDMMNIQYLVSKLNYSNCVFYNAFINSKKYLVEFTTSDIRQLKEDVLDESKEIRYTNTIDINLLLGES